MKEIFREEKETLSIKLENGLVKEISAGFQAGKGTREIPTLAQVDYDFESQDFQNFSSASQDRQLKKVLPLLAEISAAAQDCHPAVKQVEITCQLNKQQVLIEKEAGAVRDERERYYLRVEVVAGRAGKIQKAREVVGGSKTLLLARPATLGKKVALRAILMLAAPEAPLGKMPVVLAGEAGGTMIHEACGHGLEADFIARGISRYTGLLNQKVASEKITVIDDPSLLGLHGSYRYDDEGTPVSPVVLIEKGFLKNYLTDRYFADLLKIKPNGHGRRQSFRSWPVPRMANTYVAAGHEDPREILRSLKKGLYVKKLGGGQVDVVSGDFVFEVEEGYLVLNGRIRHPVRRAVLMGNGPAILTSCDAVGNDLQFSPGVCGKDDLVAVTSGQPTLRIPELLIGGLSRN